MKPSNISLGTAHSGRMPLCDRYCALGSFDVKYQMRRATFFVALVLSLGCALASETFAKFSVVLLQPQSVLQARVPSVPRLAAYIEVIEAMARDTIGEAKPNQAASGFIVVAIRPGQRSNVWLDFEPKLPVQLQDKLVKKLRSAMPARVEEGPVVFALKVGLWGGAESRRVAPSPPEWSAAAARAGRPVETGELVEMIWSD